MSIFNFFNLFSGGLNIQGSDRGELIFGSFGDDTIAGNGGNDLIFGLFGDDNISGGSGDDAVLGGAGHDTLEGGDGEDDLFGGSGDDRIVGNKGNDQMFGGRGDDMLVWNNGDGSDLMNGGSGYDQVQVNFDTDLVNDDLQNKDTAEFSVTDAGVQFARTALNGQTEAGLFQLDIRETEVLETNFGGGDDTAVIKDNVLEKIVLDLDGGDGVDTLDLSQTDAAIKVNLAADEVGASTAKNFENVIGTQFDDTINGDRKDNVIQGLGGEDVIRGRGGDDELVGGKGDDKVFGGRGEDVLVWNNGDGSDLLNGGKGNDLVQVNFDTDLVNDDLQNKDVAEFSVTDKGVQFARIEVNDQTEAGLFQLDIRNTETLETNFGDGDDVAVIKGDVLDQIVLDLDGGEGVDLLDFSQAASAIAVDLGAGTINAAFDVATGQPAQDPDDVISGSGEGVIDTSGATGEPVNPTDGDVLVPRIEPSTAINFEDITGTAFDDTITGDDGDNVIRGGSGNDVMAGGGGADTFVFFDNDVGVDIITDFEFGVDRLVFLSNDPDETSADLMSNLTQLGDGVEMVPNNEVMTFEDVVTTANLMGNLTQVGDAVELVLNNKVITFEDAVITDFTSDDFMIA